MREQGSSGKGEQGQMQPGIARQVQVKMSIHESGCKSSGSWPGRGMAGVVGAVAQQELGSARKQLPGKSTALSEGASPEPTKGRGLSQVGS